MKPQQLFLSSTLKLFKRWPYNSRHGLHWSTSSQTITEVLHECPPESDLFSFINFTLDELEGPYHCWLNFGESKDSFRRVGTFLVVAGQFLDNSIIDSNSLSMLLKVKSLQQRFPQLHIMGLQCGSSVCSPIDQSHLVQLIMKEYITFPILLSNKTFPEVANAACYILFKDSRSKVIYHEKGLDLGILNKAVEEFSVQPDESRFVHNLKSTWFKKAEITKEPYLCSLRNLLLYFPGCISADESSNRLFLSDSNHHRIIILNGNGKILDCIGSSPGFEDGAFESAKLARPAASFYHAVDDCLYFVDSENHAIRRADMGKRILETLYPTSNIDKKNNGLWTWIVNKLGLGRSVDTKSEDLDSESLMFPWHLMKSKDDTLLIINRSFETLWIMDMTSGDIEVVKGLILAHENSYEGFPKILETCGQWIMEKVSLLKQIPCDWLQPQFEASGSQEELSYACLMSSLTTLQNHIFICDTGRIDIQLNVDIPVDTELVEPLQDGCIWHQARGAATEVSAVEDVAGSSEKVGVAQQWYDELDSLAFSTPETELTVEDDNITKDNKFQDERVHINCAVNTSPGTSEVIICAVLYLKLRKNPDLEEDNQEKYAARIVDILKPERTIRTGGESCIHLLKSNKDLRDLIFMKPLHVRIKFDSPDHPKADNSKDIVLTDSSVEVNVSLYS
ncbi:protein suppressor of quenching 1 [Quercus suber]|uniref:Protein suppressor of quenching 1 n=1 Tax=Quercus suber TaxID=58331 RepID=A0AAW0KAR0_QUESU